MWRGEYRTTYKTISEDWENLETRLDEESKLGWTVVYIEHFDCEEYRILLSSDIRV